MLRCALVADDLTGACDAAVHFAEAGLRTVVPLTMPRDEAGADVLACSTESRDIPAREAGCRIRMIAGELRTMAPEIVFKKIDSTLRGNTGFEIVAAADAFRCDSVVVNPAFPAMGRTVEGGFLRLGLVGGFEPVAMTSWLQSHGAQPCRHVPADKVADAVGAGSRFITCDAVCEGDLALVAAQLPGCGRRVLWAGSAGLARALARQVGGASSARCSPLPAQSGPVLFCIGSDHPITVEQVSRLRGQRKIGTDPADLASGTHVFVAVTRGGPETRSFLAEARPAALFLSGGDTASLVCRAAGAQAIELQREFAPGIPAGILRGGAFDGLPVLTKSGGFGAPDDLIRIADYFHA